ncbi:hypothetical protein BYT27DRAFT_6685954 [Phlegmacium glaucopus]|nr:hypothetical protein BYT27DRAFT_6685954 [Phlegmacium glaucopus]
MPFHVERYLPGNDGGTLCLGITSTELASGGKDGVKIWNFHDWNPISIPPGGSGRGATTALVWIERNLLVYGTTTGCLVILRRRENDDTYFEEGWYSTPPQIISQLAKKMGSFNSTS